MPPCLTPPSPAPEQKDRELCLTALQNTITRLASYSFGAKGWAVTVASAFAVAAVTKTEPKLVLAVFVPCLFFWWIDAYYLMLERRFRARFIELLDDRSGAGLVKVFTDDPKADTGGVLRAGFSASVGPFYVALALAGLALSSALRAA